jgi:hypothetical protein
MSRQARIDTPGALHHVICRGIDRRNIFKDNTDRVRARSVLAYWAILDLYLTATAVGTYLGLSKSAVGRTATRGQKLIAYQSLSLKDYKRAISTPFTNS